MIFGTNEVMASNSGNDSPKAAGEFYIDLEVRSSLGVNLDGKASSNADAIRIGDPASGMVSYVILDN